MGCCHAGGILEHTRHELYLLCQYEVADDRDHAALAIEHGGSRSPVIQDEAIISIVQLEECRAGEPVLCPVLHELAARETQAVIGIRDARHALVCHERLRPDRKDLCTGKWVPQFEHGYPLGLGAHNTQNASRNRLRALPVPNLDLLPVRSRKVHRLGNMRDGCHRARRQEPSGPAYAEHAGVRLLLFLGKVPRNACRGLHERRGIDAGGRDTRGRQQQQDNGIKPRPRRSGDPHGRHDFAPVVSGERFGGQAGRATPWFAVPRVQPCDREQFRHAKSVADLSAFAPTPPAFVIPAGQRKMDSSERASAAGLHVS